MLTRELARTAQARQTVLLRPDGAEVPVSVPRVPMPWSEQRSWSSIGEQRQASALALTRFRAGTPDWLGSVAAVAMDLQPVPGRRGPLRADFVGLACRAPFGGLPPGTAWAQVRRWSPDSTSDSEGTARLVLTVRQLRLVGGDRQR